MKLFKMLVLLSFGIACTTSAFAQTADDLTYMTEEYPPFNFQINGKLQGISIDLLEKVFQQIGANKSRADIQLIPWAKGYEAVKNQPNTVLFAMTRTEARESLFKWVGPLAPARIVVMARKADGIKIDSVADLNKYKIGAIREDIGEQLLLSGGVSKDSVDASSSIEANIKKLDRGRIDLWAYDQTVAMYAIKKAGYNPQDFESVYVLKDGALYYAFNKGTDEGLIQKFQTALDAVKQSGEYAKILGAYGQ
ncbi:MAG: transporter substrate-binding domain-containing protein [Geopsychrobacter sp.]|nr:transporter substrate-binding domain-containing protein [Geopsychrobacter sp.]